MGFTMMHLGTRFCGCSVFEENAMFPMRELSVVVFATNVEPA